jgi:hypothetical protein
MGLDELKENLMNEPRTYPAGVTCWVDIEDADVERRPGSGVLFARYPIRDSQGAVFTLSQYSPLSEC